MYKYIVHKTYGFHFTTPALVVEKDAVFMWVLCRWCFQILYCKFALYFLFFQVRCLLSYTASFLQPWGKVLGLDLTGDRYTRISLSAPSQITCHSASSLREGSSVSSRVLPFALESKLPKLKPAILPLIVYSGKILAEGGSGSRGNWRFGDSECFLSKRLVSLWSSAGIPISMGFSYSACLVCFQHFTFGEPLGRDLGICLPKFVSFTHWRMIMLWMHK